MTMINKNPGAKAVKFIVMSCLLLAGGGLFISNIGWAQEAKALELQEGEIITLPISSVRRIAIGDPAIADIKVISDKDLMLMARAKGQTELIIWDGSGRREFTIEVVSRVVLDEVIDRLKELLKVNDIEGVTVIQKGENIFLIGEILHSSDMEQIKQIVHLFPGVISLVREATITPLVQLNVEVVEMSITDKENLGINWLTSFPTYYKLDDMVWEQEGRRSTDLNITLGFFEKRSLIAALNFLMTETDARILAKPNLVVSSGKEGKILAGGEMPVLSSTQQGALPTIQWKPYGVSLNIRPTVLKNGNINIAMQTEVSAIDFDIAYGVAEGSTVYGMGTRSAETEVVLKNGETMVIGGLIKNTKTETVHKFPILGDIPLINRLFKSTDTTIKELDLVIFITPIIIERGEERTADNVVDLRFIGRKD